MTISEALATPARFMQWLVEVSTPDAGQRFPSRERIVGVRAVNESCPIASFLRDGLGVAAPVVSTTSVQWQHGPAWTDFSHTPTPAWAKRFIRSVDAPVDLARATGKDWTEGVTAQEAIYILLEGGLVMTYDERAQVGEIIASPGGFRDWLKHGDPERVVGIRADQGACPYANYLKAGPELSFPDVDAEGVRWSPDRPAPYPCFVPSPAWLSSFIHQVDETYYQAERNDTGYCSKVTAREALAILDKIGG